MTQSQRRDLIEEVALMIALNTGGSVPVRVTAKKVVDRVAKTMEAADRACCPGGPQWGHAFTCPTLP